MMSTAELKSLPRAEKLQLLEDIWEDLAPSLNEMASPAWHEAELRRTEEDFAAGCIPALDAEQVWKELRQVRG